MSSSELVSKGNLVATRLPRGDVRYYGDTRSRLHHIRLSGHSIKFGSTDGMNIRPEVRRLGLNTGFTTMRSDTSLFQLPYVTNSACVNGIPQNCFDV